MRKTDGTLDQQRARIRAEYKRGRIQGREITGDASLSEVERQIKQEICCYLKAQDFSYAYMADALGVSRSTVKNWFSDSKLGLPVKVAKIRADFVSGALKLMKTYAIEIIETQMQIMRTTDDEALAVKIGFELLDRLGISKVSKSESISAQTLRNESEIDIVDRTGLLALAQKAPPHVQAKMAEQMEDMLSLAREHASLEPLPMREDSDG